MRGKTDRSLEITDIIGDVVRSIECAIYETDPDGYVTERKCPPVNYVFGNAQYVRDRLNELSKSTHGSVIKYPLVALFVPISEKRGDARYRSQMKVKILIAVGTRRDWSNEQRARISFANVLRPIYRAFLEALKKDGRLAVAYNGTIPHEYSENYSYGRYGAYTSPGETLPDPIDAIDINNLELTVKNINCISR